METSNAKITVKEKFNIEINSVQSRVFKPRKCYSIHFH